MITFIWIVDNAFVELVVERKHVLTIFPVAIINDMLPTDQHTVFLGSTNRSLYLLLRIDSRLHNRLHYRFLRDDSYYI